MRCSPLHPVPTKYYYEPRDKVCKYPHDESHGGVSLSDLIHLPLNNAKVNSREASKEGICNAMETLRQRIYCALHSSKTCNSHWVYSLHIQWSNINNLNSFSNPGNIKATCHITITSISLRQQSITTMLH